MRPYIVSLSVIVRSDQIISNILLIADNDENAIDSAIKSIRNNYPSANIRPLGVELINYDIVRAAAQAYGII